MEIGLIDYFILLFEIDYNGIEIDGMNKLCDSNVNLDIALIDYLKYQLFLYLAVYYMPGLYI